jgi:glycosyltransferase involved in cell wall biosynthesis
VEIAREHAVDSRVHFVGALFEQDKWAAYRDADAFVLPSQNENFGNTAAEAAAAGTPVIVTKECGVAPLLGDRAALIVPHDEGAITHALDRVLGDPVLHTNLALGCREAVARLGWEEPATQMSALYSQLVGAESRVA